MKNTDVVINKTRLKKNKSKSGGFSLQKPKPF